MASEQVITQEKITPVAAIWNAMRAVAQTGEAWRIENSEIVQHLVDGLDYGSITVEQVQAARDQYDPEGSVLAVYRDEPGAEWGSQYREWNEPRGKLGETRLADHVLRQATHWQHRAVPVTQAHSAVWKAVLQSLGDAKEYWHDRMTQDTYDCTEIVEGVAPDVATEAKAAGVTREQIAAVTLKTVLEAAEKWDPNGTVLKAGEEIEYYLGDDERNKQPKGSGFRREHVLMVLRQMRDTWGLESSTDETEALEDDEWDTGVPAGMFCVKITNIK